MNADTEYKKTALLPFAPRALAGGERAGGMRGLTARKAVFLNR